jgi:hypothetical protein
LKHQGKGYVPDTQKKRKEEALNAFYCFDEFLMNNSPPAERGGRMKSGFAAPPLRHAYMV